MPTELYNERVRELFGMSRGTAGSDRVQRLMERTATGVETLESDTTDFHTDLLRLEVEQLKLLKKVERGIRDLKGAVGGGNAIGGLDLLGDALEALDRRRGGNRGNPAARTRGRPSQPRDASTGRYIRESQVPRRPGEGVTRPRADASRQVATRAVIDTENAVARTYRSISQSVSRAIDGVTAVPRNVMAAGRGVLHSINTSVSNYAMRAASGVGNAIRSTTAAGGRAVSNAVSGAVRGAGSAVRSVGGAAGRLAGPLAAGFAINDFRAGATNRDLIGTNPSIGKRAFAGTAAAANGFLNWGLGNPLDEASKYATGRGFTENAMRGWNAYEGWAGQRAADIRSAWASILGNTTAGANVASPDAVRDSLAKTPAGRAALGALGIGGIPGGIDLSPNPATKGGRLAPAMAPVEFPTDRWATGDVGVFGPRGKQINDRQATLDYFARRTARSHYSAPGNGDVRFGIANTDAPQLTSTALNTTITTLKTTTLKIQSALNAQTDAVVGATTSLEQSLGLQGDAFDKLNKAISQGGVGFGVATGAIGGAAGASGGIGSGGGNGYAAGDQVTANTAGNARGQQTLQRTAYNRRTGRIYAGPTYAGDTAPVSTRAFTGSAASGVHPGDYGAFTGNNNGAAYTTAQARAVGGSGTGPTGALSAKYEGKVDTVGGDGGRAYGKYQFDYKAGGLQTFFKDNPAIAQQFAGLEPGTAAFNAKWKAVAAADPKGFEAAQDRSARSLWYDPAAAHAAKAGFKTDNRGVQEALFSGSIQHGEFNRLLDETASTPGFAAMGAEDQIKAFYGARRNFDRVQALDPARRKGVLDRYDREEPDALRLARENAPGAPGTMSTNARAFGGAPMGVVDGGLVPFKGITLGPQGDALAAIGDRRGAANLFSGRGSQRGQTFNPRTDLTSIATPKGEKWNVHKDAAYAFQGFLNELEASGYPLYSSGGYNNRNKRGGSYKSEHAFGTAIDVNSRENPMGPNLVTDLPPNISDMAAKWGLSWGGDWKNSKDAMHFEWRGITQEQLLEAQANPTGAAAVKIQKILADTAATAGGTRGGGLGSILGKGGGIARREQALKGMATRTKDDLLTPSASRARIRELDKELEVENARMERMDKAAAIKDTTDGRGGRVGGSNFDSRWDAGDASQPANAALENAVGKMRAPQPVEPPANEAPSASGKGGRVAGGVAKPTPRPEAKPPASPVRQTQLNDVPDIGELKMLMANSNMMA